MSFVALISSDQTINQILQSSFETNVHFHTINLDKSPQDICDAITALNYYGAIVLEPSWQENVVGHVQRKSLMVEKFAAADTLIVTPAGIVADYSIGTALSQLLEEEQWNVRDANVVVTGSSPFTGIVAHELSSMGIRRLTLVGENQVGAQSSLPQTAGTSYQSLSYADASVNMVLERADLIVKTGTEYSPPESLLGPHLSVLDLSPSPLSPLRQHAMNVGAPNLGLRDLQAHQLSISLGLITGQRYDVATFRDPLLAL